MFRPAGMDDVDSSGSLRLPLAFDGSAADRRRRCLRSGLETILRIVYAHSRYSLLIAAALDLSGLDHLSFGDDQKSSHSCLEVLMNARLANAITK